MAKHYGSNPPAYNIRLLKILVREFIVGKLKTLEDKIVSTD